jgi:site-specific recombinase XerD
LDRLLEEFAAYLVSERGLAERTIYWYRHVAGLFLSAQRQGSPEAAGSGLEGLTAKGVSAFLLAESRHRSVGSINSVAVALRALMRFLYVQGHTATSLAAAVPAAPCWRDSGISRALEEGHVDLLLANCDRRTASGCRDFAILTAHPAKRTGRFGSNGPAVSAETERGRRGGDATPIQL